MEKKSNVESGNGTGTETRTGNRLRKIEDILTVLLTIIRCSSMQFEKFRSCYTVVRKGDKVIH